MAAAADARLTTRRSTAPPSVVEAALLISCGGGDPSPAPPSLPWTDAIKFATRSSAAKLSSSSSSSSVAWLESSLLRDASMSSGGGADGVAATRPFLAECGERTPGLSPFRVFTVGGGAQGQGAGGGAQGQGAGVGGQRKGCVPHSHLLEHPSPCNQDVPTHLRHASTPLETRVSHDLSGRIPGRGPVHCAHSSAHMVQPGQTPAAPGPLHFPGPRCPTPPCLAGATWCTQPTQLKTHTQIRR